jgi:hypothetical protein
MNEFAAADVRLLKALIIGDGVAGPSRPCSTGFSTTRPQLLLAARSFMCHMAQICSTAFC